MPLSMSAMSTATIDIDSELSAADDLQYKALHTGALIALVLGVLSVCVVITAASSFEYCLMVAPIPLMGIFFALRAIGTIRRYPDQYTGLALAQIGLVLSIVFLVGGVAYGGYVYATEVPDGYTRISFTTMKPDELQERGGTIIPPEVAALEGKKIFIKGYIRPDSITVPHGIDRFLLVRDNNQCCFGDLSKIKYYDQIDVLLTGDNRVDYTQGVFRIGGVLHIEPQYAAYPTGRPVFSLKADYAKN
jgi:hypothetical protein